MKLILMGWYQVESCGQREARCTGRLPENGVDNATGKFSDLGQSQDAFVRNENVIFGNKIGMNTGSMVATVSHEIRLIRSLLMADASLY